MVDRRKRKDSGAGKLPWLAQRQSEGTPQVGKEDSRSRPRWRKRTRQEEGRQTEKELAKKRGAKVHPASGALRIKNDASTKEILYEIKDANKTYTLKGSELQSLWKNAIKQLKDPVFVVYFQDTDITATMTITKGKK